MNVITWIIFGLIAGGTAQFLMPGKHPKGWVITILLGMGGAVVGGCTSLLWGGAGFTGFNFRSMVLATLGSVVLLGIYRVFAPLEQAKRKKLS